jgi:GT2 family glycosyltransferase
MGEMVYGIATRGWNGFVDCVMTWHNTASKEYPDCVALDMNVLEAYQYIFERTTEPILALIHDDCKILEQDWDLRVLKQFEDPQVGLVGFGGALRLGHPEIYKIPYELPQLARYDFQSNMRNAEAHGRRFSGECDVATIDGFAMFVRRSVLEKAGGWPLGTPCGYFNYDNWLACEVRRQGLRTRLVGVECDHLGGKTASMVHVTDSHAEAHVWLYETCRDVLPMGVR